MTITTVALGMVAIGLIGWLVVAMLDDSDANDVWLCKKCKIASREIMVKLKNNSHDTLWFSYVTCPHCEEKVKMDRADSSTTTPFAPYVPYIQRFKINQAISKSSDNEDSNRQIQAYLELQEKKLEKMKAGANIELDKN